MESTQQSDRQTYRVIVFGPGGDELLLKKSGDDFLLPSLEIPRSQRLAQNMTVAIQNEWGQEAICLFNLHISAPVASADNYNYEVMQCSGPGKSHPRAKWVPVSSLSVRTLVDPADQVAVQRSLAESDSRVSAAVLGPFARLGWFRQLHGWVEEVIGPLGFHLTGSFSQLNASPTFSLVRFETSGPAIWFKAVGEPNLREFPVTLTLARLFPHYLPPILAARPEWSGWLALEAEGTNLGETQNTQNWKASVSALAKLQVESTGKVGTIVNSGVRDLRAPALLKLVRPFLDVMSQLMEKQTKVPPRILSRSELILLGQEIEEALSLSTDLRIPDALGHLDLNPENVIVSDGKCVFLDWAEGYVGNPLFSLQYLVEHFRRLIGVNTTVKSVLTSAYAEVWQSSVSPKSLQEALALTPMLAVFAYAAATDAWSDAVRLEDPEFAGYLRSLTRRMHREAAQLWNRSALCPN
jgi:hypothetical protein